MKKETVKEAKGNNKREKYIAEKKTEKKEKKKKGNIFKRIARYFKGVAKEIGRIKWTTGKDLVKYSIAAIMFVVFFGLYFYAIDWFAILIRSLVK